MPKAQQEVNFSNEVKAMNTSELEYRKPLEWGEIDPYRRGRTHVGMWAWLLQRISAVFIIILLCFHLCYPYKPYVQFLLLLTLALHASLGVRVILLDLDIAKIKSARRLVPWALGIGIALAVIIWVAIY